MSHFKLSLKDTSNKHLWKKFQSVGSIWYSSLRTFSLSVHSIAAFVLTLIQASGHLMFPPVNLEDFEFSYQSGGIKDRSGFILGIKTCLLQHIYWQFVCDSVNCDSCAFPCERGYNHNGAKGCTCANQVEYVPTCPCVYVKMCAYDFEPQSDYKNVRMCNHTERK